MEKIMDDFAQKFAEEIKNMNPQELALLNDVYLSFSSKFIEYVREIDPILFNRALDYASTVEEETLEDETYEDDSIEE